MTENSSQNSEQVESGSKGNIGRLVNWVFWAVFQAAVASGNAVIIFTTPPGIPGVSLVGFAIWALAIGALGLLISIWIAMKFIRIQPENKPGTRERLVTRATVVTAILLISQGLIGFASTCENGLWSQLVAPGVVAIAALAQLGSLFSLLLALGDGPQQPQIANLED